MKQAQFKVTCDIGLGDAITPAPQMGTYPALLDYVAPQIRMYSRETVIAEKLDAMLVLGLRNG